MDKIHIAALRNCRVKLVSDLEHEALLDFLEQTQVFTKEMVADIKAEKTHYKKNRRLLDDLQRRGPKAFDYFLSGLVMDQKHLAEMLRLEVDRLRQLPPGAPLTALSQPHQAETPHISGMSALSAGGQCVTQATLSPGESERGQVVTEVSGEPGQPQSSTVTPMETDRDTGSSSSSTGPANSTGEPIHLYQQENMSAYDAHPNKYHMESTPRGYVLIINNITFNEPRWNRQGAEVDGENLISVFRDLGYLVEYQKDLTAQEMRSTVKAYAELKEHNHVDSCIMAILSHGDLNGMVYGKDCVMVNFKDMYGCFSSQNCPQLRGKPKLFILQACRGQHWNSVQGRSDVDAAPFCLPADLETSQSDAARNMSLSPEISNSLPSNSDVILAFSTSDGEVSYRNTVLGSWYIQALTKVFKEDHRTTSVVDLLIKVNDIVASRHHGSTQGPQMPAPVIMTRKPWFFNAPVKEV